MAPRLDLHALLLTMVPNVYFQPPESFMMVYPCIVYKRDYETTQFANDKPYRRGKRYQLTIIDENPDTPIPDMVADLPMCVFDRFYTADNLNHYVYKIFF